MGGSTWLTERNEKARARLERSLPEIFPGAVLLHALSRPFLPATPRRAVDSYWRQHPVRADRLARALAAKSGAPKGWAWRVGLHKASGAVGFRVPPTPFREPAHAKGPGHCCVCGQPVFRLGWHRDLWGGQAPNPNATWHACCVAAWNLWIAPSDHVRHLKALQKRRCVATGERLLRSAEVDHRVPVFRVWRGGALPQSIASPLTRPSPNGRRVGIRIVTFEACSGFTRVTARRIAQPPKATFVTRLQPFRLPGRAARQLPDQSTTLRVESSSTGDSRLRGAMP